RRPIAIINRNHVLIRLPPPLRRMEFSEATIIYADAQTMSAAKIMRLILACIVALIVTTLMHSGPSHGQTQSEMTQQARDEFLKADQRLNAPVFSSLITKVSAAGKASLRDAEKTWIRFRDQECAFETMGSVGGSVHPMVVSQCKSRLTIQRTKDLEGQLNCK